MLKMAKVKNCVPLLPVAQTSASVKARVNHLASVPTTAHDTVADHRQLLAAVIQNWTMVSHLWANREATSVKWRHR